MAHSIEDPVLNEFFDFSGASFDDMAGVFQPGTSLLTQGIPSADNEK
jgi:hypothetical protein